MTTLFHGCINRTGGSGGLDLIWIVGSDAEKHRRIDTMPFWTFTTRLKGKSKKSEKYVVEAESAERALIETFPDMDHDEVQKNLSQVDGPYPSNESAKFSSVHFILVYEAVLQG